MAKKRILLTGGSGMVGRNVLENPAFLKHEILAPSRRELDLTDAASLNNYLSLHRPDMIIHAAGKVGGIQANIREPVDFLATNVEMARNLIMSAKRHGISRLINLGSSCMYPRNQSEPLCEAQILTGPLEPTNEGYALAKVFAARLCEYVTRENPRLQYKTIIPCNLYGRYDKFDPSDSHLVPAIIHKLHQARENGEKTVEIWGDGTARREFMYAGDLADALAAAVEHFDTLPAMMNVGLGNDYSIDEYYQIAAEIIGYQGGFVHNLGRPVGMARKLVSIEQQLKWGWSAMCNVRTGIQLTYDYYLKEIIR